MEAEKQKAIELVELFKPHVRIKSREKTIEESILDEAKQCAIKCCERTIEVLRRFQELEHSDQFWYLENMIQEEETILTHIKEM